MEEGVTLNMEGRQDGTTSFKNKKKKKNLRGGPPLLWSFEKKLWRRLGGERQRREQKSSWVTYLISNKKKERNNSPKIFPLGSRGEITNHNRSKQGGSHLNPTRGKRKEKGGPPSWNKGEGKKLTRSLDERR